MKRIDRLRMCFRYDSETANAIGVSKQRFYWWCKLGKELPKWTWPDAARVIGVSLEEFKRGFENE